MAYLVGIITGCTLRRSGETASTTRGGAWNIRISVSTTIVRSSRPGGDPGIGGPGVPQVSLLRPGRFRLAIWLVEGRCLGAPFKTARCMGVACCAESLTALLFAVLKGHDFSRAETVAN